MSALFRSYLCGRIAAEWLIKMNDKTQSRKWHVTINNPLEASLNHDAIIEILNRFSLDYYCLCDEIASTGTFHTHVYLYSSSPIRFGTLKNRFPIAHIEKAYGTSQDNRDYIRKEGKWAETEKSETSVPGSFLEWGEIPTEASEKAPQQAELIECIRNDMTNVEIISKLPQYIFRIKDIDILRQTLLTEKYLSENRNIEVTYVFGNSNTGKTRTIFDRYGSRNIFRITNYRNGKGISFDSYSGQDVLVFEGFTDQVPISDMLHYLDVYPLMLPARYSDHVACYTKVFLISNIPLEQQYPWVRVNKPDTWRAFERRIHNIIQFLPGGEVVEHKKDGVYNEPN